MKATASKFPEDLSPARSRRRSRRAPESFDSGGGELGEEVVEALLLDRAEARADAGDGFSEKAMFGGPLRVRISQGAIDDIVKGPALDILWVERRIEREGLIIAPALLGCG